MKALKIFSALVLMVVSGVSFAAPITYDFIATGFQSGGNGGPAPDLNLAGSFELDGVTLTGIDLTIAGHIYDLSEVAYENSWALLGGTACDISCIPWGINDFWLSFDLNTLTFNHFYYAVEGLNDVWYTTVGSITTGGTEVPEPSGILLMLLGMVGLAAIRFTKKA